MATRIRKNAKKRIREIADSIKLIDIRSLDNGFKGEEYKPNEMYLVKEHGSVFNWLVSELNDRAELFFGENSGCLRVHSNLWFDLKA